MRSLSSIPCVVAFLFLAVPCFGATWIEEYAAESAAANKVCVVKDYAECRKHLQRIYELLDGRADIVYRLAKVEAALGNRHAAVAWLSLYSKSGLTFADPASDNELASLRETGEFPAILARLRTARQGVSVSTAFQTLPVGDLIAEDITYDRVSDRFFVSSVRHRKIFAIHKGKIAEFVPEEQSEWGIMALGVDTKLRWLWASTAAMPEVIGFKSADEGRSALLKYSLDTGALIKRYDLPKDAKHALGDMTVGSSGDVYVSDGFGSVYCVRHEREVLEVLIEKGTFRSPQTPALSSDERKLFVPDYSRGISVVDLESKQVKLLEHRRELSLGGIDGLYLTGRTLIAIQNGTTPARVIRMTLDPSLTKILYWETVEANWDGLGQPTHGVVVGSKFYFIANSGWDRMADNGALKPGAKFEAASIREMPLSARPPRH